MSEMKRFKRDIRVDGWPISDCKTKLLLDMNDLVDLMNELEAENKRLRDQLAEQK